MWRKEWPTDKHFHYLTTNPSQKHSFVLNIYKTEINYRVTKTIGENDIMNEKKL